MLFAGGCTASNATLLPLQLLLQQRHRFILRQDDILYSACWVRSHRVISIAIIHITSFLLSTKVVVSFLSTLYTSHFVLSSQLLLVIAKRVSCVFPLSCLPLFIPPPACSSSVFTHHCVSFPKKYTVRVIVPHLIQYLLPLHYLLQAPNWTHHC